MRSTRPLFMLVTAGVVATAALLTCGTRITRADENKKNELRREIEQLLSDTASELRDVPSDSSTSDLERTIDYAGRVYDKARELKDHAENDSDARRMADYYPDYARKYQDSARYLKEMKNTQRRLDEYPRKCEDAMRELASRMRAYTDSHDPRGVEEVPKLAREFGKVGKDALELAEKTRYEQATWYDRVDDFSESDGKWSDVRSNLHGAGRSMLEYVQKQQEQMKRDDVCGNLAKEERNPIVEEAMRKLFEGKKGIEMLYTSLDGQLGELASSLDGLVGDSSDSDINTAEQKLTEVERLLEQLDRIKGNDGEAKRRVETWRNIVRAGREALKHLRVLKQAQFLADKAPEKCRDATTRLTELIRSYSDERDEDAADQLKLRARGMGAPIKEGLSKTDEQHTVMERALSDAQRFDPSEGRWREVTDKHKSSAAAIFEYWKKAREAAHTACDDLAKGDQHPEVIKAAEDLATDKTSAKGQMLVLEADERKWEEGIKELRDWYKQDTANVRELFCKIPESPGDSAEGDAYAAQLTQIADRMRDRIKPKWQTISNDAAAMIARAEVLSRSKQKPVRVDALKLKDLIIKKMASMQNLLDNELNGSNDPEVRAKMEFGKNEHKRIQADSSKCTVSEVTFGSRRVDCIRVDGATCYVVEIKPNNEDARKLGRKQMDDGIDEIIKALAGTKKRSELSDKLEVFRPCFDEASEKATLKPELRVYEYCPADGELYKDFVVP